MINRILGFFSHDIGVDLGTANTLVLVRGKGIVVREPSVVAIHAKSKAVLAVGEEAKSMIGKTPANIYAIRPLKDGVISDFEVTQKMLEFFIRKVHRSPTMFPKVPRPRVVVGIPSSVTEVERRAVVDAAKAAGARQAFLVEEPMAAAIGAGLPVEEPVGSMIVDIGGGTSEIAVVSLGGIVVRRSLKIAGDEMNEAIVDWAKSRCHLLLGERTAEEVKIELGEAFSGKKRESVMRGRDLKTGLPRSISVTSEEIREVLDGIVSTIITSIKDVIEETPPELVPDIIGTGITLAGGGALLSNLDKRIENEVRVPVRVADDPLTCVVRGAGAVLESLDLLEKVKVEL